MMPRSGVRSSNRDISSAAQNDACTRHTLSHQSQTDRYQQYQIVNDGYAKHNGQRLIYHCECWQDHIDAQPTQK